MLLVDAVLPIGRVYVHKVTAAHGGPAHINPAAQCSPAPLQDTADHSPADIAQVRAGYFFRSGFCSCDASELSRKLIWHVYSASSVTWELPIARLI